VSTDREDGLRVGIGGLGTIGLPVARWLATGPAGLRLVAVSAQNRERAAERLSANGIAVPVVVPGALAERADVVIECMPAAVFDAVAVPAVEAGRIFIAMSVGALLDRLSLVETARRTGARIIVPSGAILGLDAVRAAAQGTIRSVRMITRKPPQSLAGSPYLEQNRISLDGLTRPIQVFSGTAREGARGFPANVNVAAALGLAGIGPDATTLEIWADPALTRNTHRIEVEADSACFTMTIEGVPSEDNARTGKLTPLSVIACLKGLVEPLRIGT
jgi:aspartate dehydrogenase